VERLTKTTENSSQESDATGNKICSNESNDAVLVTPTMMMIMAL
jgi:hypothetical protein